MSLPQSRRCCNRDRSGMTWRGADAEDVGNVTGCITQIEGDLDGAAVNVIATKRIVRRSVDVETRMGVPQDLLNRHV